ncbi:transporter [Polaromonas sp.]|nr:transporter [Polaromonas sp.]
MNSPHLLLLAVLCLGAYTPAQAQAQSQPMSFEMAWDRVKTGSDQLAAAQAAIDGNDLQTQGLKGLGGPIVNLVGATYRYNISADLDLGPVNQELGHVGQELPLPLPIPQLPSNYTLNHHNSGNIKQLAALWPIYTGGADDAVRGFIGAQGHEVRADADKTSHELTTLLVQRYFGTQLAVKAAALRQAALNDIQQHDDAAAKMLVAGVISLVERLQAQTAYEEARRNAIKAQDDAELAAIALARTVKSSIAVQPNTPLFVLTQPVESLPHFLNEALLRHPGLAKINAKKEQAEELHNGKEALRRPQIFAFGLREIKTGNADWIGGLGVTWTLFDSVDRNALAAASIKQIEQAELTELQARSDISLLVEKNWRSLEQTRQQFIATAPGIALAHEVLRLRTAALREGTGTTLELIDAEVNQTKVETERAQIAFGYVAALAQLLESCGLSEEFGAYIQRADVKVY